MRMKFIYVLLFLFIAPWIQAATVDFKNFKNIVVDLRGSRGGNGDVSAGYLVAGQLIKEKGVKKLTLVIDEKTRGILTTLVGHKIEDGEKIWDGAVEVKLYENIKEPLQAVDLFFQFAKKNSQDNLSNSIYRPGDPESNRRGKIQLSPDAFWITHTVLGNSEARREEAANFGGIRHGLNDYYISSPGLRPEENGVYSDQTAKALLGMSGDEVLKNSEMSLKQEKAINSKDPKRQKELRVIEGTLFDHARGKVLKGSEQGFAYGLMSTFQKTDMEAYLDGLKNAAQKLKKSYVIFSPVRYENVNDIVGQKRRDFPKIENVEYVNLSEEPFDLQKLPQDAEAGKVYFVTVPKLSNAMFNQFLYRSTPIPVIAGDGALSAAINMKKPFLMTVVPWNEHNVESVYLQKAAQVAPESETQNLLLQGFDPDEFYRKDESIRLKIIESLETKARLKKEYSKPLAAHDLLDRTQEQLATIVDFESQKGNVDYSKIADPNLKISLLVKAAKNGSESAAKLLEGLIPHENPFDFLQFFEAWKLYMPFDTTKKSPYLESLWIEKIRPYFKNKLRETPYFSEILNSALKANPHNPKLWKMITDALFDKVEKNPLGDPNERNVSLSLEKALKMSPELKDTAYVHLKAYLPLIENEDGAGHSLFKLLLGQPDFNAYVDEIYLKKSGDAESLKTLRQQILFSEGPIPEKIWAAEIETFLESPYENWGHDWHRSPRQLLISALRRNPWAVISSEDKKLQKAYKIIFSNSKDGSEFFDTGWGKFWEGVLKTRKTKEKEALLNGQHKPFLKDFYRILKLASTKEFSSFSKNTLACTKLFQALKK